jgi:hypothetical protein
MINCTRRVFLSLLLLVLLGLHQNASAQFLYAGSESGTFSLTPTSLTTADITGSAIGSDNLGGAFTADITAVLDFSNPLLQIASNGTFSRTYTNGGSLFGTFTGTLAPTGPTTGVFSLPTVITGGTGLFAGVSGTGLEEGSAVFTSLTTADFTSSFRATLQGVVPEPGLMGWMAGMGLMGLYYGCRRRR